MRFVVTLVVHSCPPPSSAFKSCSNKLGGLRDPELNPAAHSSSPELIGVRPASEGPRMSSHQSTRAEWWQWFTLWESLFFLELWLAAILGSLLRSVQLSLSLSGPGFDKDTSVLTQPPLPSHHLPLSSPPPPTPFAHTLSCCSLPVSLDLTPHTRQPLSGRGRAEWDCLLAPGWMCLYVNVGQS